MKMRILLILLFGLLIQYGCTKSSPSEEEGPLDPNKEEEKLKAFKADEAPGVVKVMTRNVYVGTDVDLILEAENLENIPFYVNLAYNMMIATDFTERANALADEIAKTLPHVIGLQEMSNTYTQIPSDFLAGNPVKASDPLYNFEEILMDAIDAKGLNYTVAAVIENADVEVPMLTGLDNNQNPVLEDVRLVDHDMILVRNDVTYSNPVSVHYDSMLVVAPEMGIVVPRGYVKVNVEIGPASFVFANTHLESASVDELRLDQATQLVRDLSAENLSVILAGDFNSRAGSGTTYNYVTSHGFTDTWLSNTLTYNTNGYTFGHQSDLMNENPDFFERIDFIFVKSTLQLGYGEGFVLGDEIRDKTPSGLWPSDHGGVVFKILFPVPTKLAAN